MDFKETTDVLFMDIGHADLAAELGVSIAAIRQGRLPATAKAHRKPPAGWEKAVRRLAERRIAELETLLLAGGSDAKPKEAA